MEELIPTEDEIEWAVRRLKKHRSGEVSGMRAEHLKGWLAEVQKEESAAAKAKTTERKVAEIRGPGGGRDGGEDIYI